VEVQIVNTSEVVSRKASSSQLFKYRQALAAKLRAEYPGQWALISQGHATRGSARQVRDRVRAHDWWDKFEWSVRAAPDGDGFNIYAKAPDPSAGPAVDQEPSVHLVSVDEVSPIIAP